MIAALLLLSCRPADPPFVSGPSRPTVAGKNVLVLLLDDVATDRIGVYAEHPQPARTPTIDGLAARGVRFTDAYAYPVCSPSRAALLTGRHPRRAGIGFNVRPDADHALALHHGVLPELVAAGGYTPVGVGKWHLQPRDQATIQHPLEHGFVRYDGVIDNLVKPDSYTDYPWHHSDGTVEAHASTYLTTREIDALIERVRDTQEPWLVWGAVHAPHGPWQAPPEPLLASPLPNPATPADLYDATLEAFDTELARLLAVVDWSDTIVVLIGDNGTPREVVREPISGDMAKGSVFEAGVRVPWLMAGAGIPEGRVSGALVSVLDLFPTIAEVVGVDPVRAGVPIDGVSLWPLIAGEAAGVRDFVYSERHYPDAPGASVRMARDARFKLVERGVKRESLHDLAARDDDGPDRLAGALADDERAAYERLKAEIRRVSDDLDEGAGCLP